ncbi:hypothetical protein KFK09_011977 [Dendrobium nobile]|uniref:Uncharacterized protein n=1 Tax=Dendrobium nobile TaxID=94219 RepID=A0A8T3BJN2_DENNO|nr:hypothetical protein KFK09_011977 [Dendrobium nobile]
MVFFYARKTIGLIRAANEPSRAEYVSVHVCVHLISACSILVHVCSSFSIFVHLN